VTLANEHSRCGLFDTGPGEALARAQVGTVRQGPYVRGTRPASRRCLTQWEPSAVDPRGRLGNTSPVPT
jgi:hypothetical protein